MRPRCLLCMRQQRAAASMTPMICFWHSSLYAALVISAAEHEDGPSPVHANIDKCTIHACADSMMPLWRMQT
jgi:hypothetical protein